MTPDTLMRYLAVVFLFLVVLSAYVVFALDILYSRQPDIYVTDIVYAGLGYAMTTAGVTHGSKIAGGTNGNTSSTS
jgi:hypothetical protein